MHAYNYNSFHTYIRIHTIYQAHSHIFFNTHKVPVNQVAIFPFWYWGSTRFNHLLKRPEISRNRTGILFLTSLQISLCLVQQFVQQFTYSVIEYLLIPIMCQVIFQGLRLLLWMEEKSILLLKFGFYPVPKPLARELIPMAQTSLPKCRPEGVWWSQVVSAWSILLPVSNVFFQVQSQKVNTSLGRKGLEGKARPYLDTKRTERRMLCSENKNLLTSRCLLLKQSVLTFGRRIFIGP